MNRSMLGRLENENYKPSIDQLETLAEILEFDAIDIFVDDTVKIIEKETLEAYNIAVTSTGYVGLSLAVLLAQHNHVTAVDIIPKKVEMINNKKSSIQDDYIEKYHAEKALYFIATLDCEAVYKEADFVIIAVPINYDSKKKYFDTSAVEVVIELVLKTNPDTIMIS